MFPYRDDNPSILTPVVTVGLIAANLAIWIVFQGMGNPQRVAASVCELGLIPGDLLQRLPIGYSFPVGEGMSCVVEAGRSWETVITSMFLHGGWLHVLANCWFLWVFGNNVEDGMGHLRFLSFYLLCGIAAAGAQIAVDPSSPIPMVGASGAVSGIMGAYIVLYPRVRVHTLVFLLVFFFRATFPAWTWLGLWFFVQLVNSRLENSGGVAVWAHIGGFLAGAILIWLFRSPVLLERRARLLATRTLEGFAR
jgi:membrane associated rhomboid family serine protease